jgi:hypothetical protein
MKKWWEIAMAVVLAVFAALLIEYFRAEGHGSPGDSSGKGFKLTIEYEKK